MTNGLPDPLVPSGTMLALLDQTAPSDHVQAQIKSISQRPVANLRKGVAAATGRQRSLRHGESFIIDGLGIAVLHEPQAAEVESLAALVEDRDSGIIAARPEYFVSVTEEPKSPEEWKRRYGNWLQEAATLLASTPDGYRPDFPELDDDAISDEAPPETGASPDHTWGLRATSVDRSSLTGAGVRIAIVDTGVALSHPAFVGRNIEAVSFVPYENSEDRHGHGTHCFGTACGATVADEPRYGIATGAEALVAKCLDATGLGRESWILAGIDWALSQGADIISLSLGLPYGPDGAADPIYTQLGEIALAEGSLLIAASGNGSSRPGRIEPALLPAAVPSVLSVGALAEDLTIAPFSNGKAFGGDRQVDLLAPGVGVYSTHLPPINFKSLSGTSMATPHVAGIAGLLAESDPSLRGRALWDTLVALQQDLGIGQGAAGLVRAPAGQGVGS